MDFSKPMGSAVSPAAAPLPRIHQPQSDHQIDDVSQTNEKQGMEVYEIDPLGDPRWSGLVKDHPSASVFHDPRWLAALRVAYGYNPIVFTTCHPDRPLTNGLAFCQIKSWLTGRRLVSLPFSDHCEPLVESSVMLDRLLARVKASVDQSGWKYLEIRPISCVPVDQSEIRKSTAYYLHRLDLRKSTEELFRGFHKDCVQRKIRRAEREALEYEGGNSEALLKKFYRLLVMTRRRQHLPPQPISWFRALMASFGQDLKIRVASKDGVAVASILTLVHKKIVTYKYGCSDTEFNKLGGTALLFWRTIQEAKEKGFEELDMGRSDMDNSGLVTFKGHWGATQSSLDYWQYPHSLPGLQSPWKMKVLGKMVAVAPDVSLTAAGSILYRHIG
jgi:CelD/BcsL family acetyltransferase involved in cellulose biosynthesis